MSEEEPPGAGKELDELSAMGAAAVRKREKWKWLLPSWAPAATTLSGTHEETFRADDIRLSAGYWSSSSSWNSRSFTCLLALAFIFQSVSALPPVIRIGTKIILNKNDRQEPNYYSPPLFLYNTKKKKMLQSFLSIFLDSTVTALTASSNVIGREKKKRKRN